MHALIAEKYEGSTLRLTATFTSADGTPAAPTGVAFAAYHADGSLLQASGAAALADNVATMVVTAANTIVAGALAAELVAVEFAATFADGTKLTRRHQVRLRALNMITGD